MVKPQEGENMTDDLDVEAMLEAPYKKGDEAGNKVKENGDKDSKSKSSSKKSKRRSHSRSRSKSHERERDRRRRSVSRGRGRDRDRRRSHSRERHERERGAGDRRRGRDHERETKKRSRSRSPKREKRDERRRRTPSPVVRQMLQIVRPPEQELTPEERDQRTVFCMQLSARIRARDLEEFFSSVGRVKDVRIITDNKTRRSKGIAYVEFYDVDAIPLALGLAGQKLLGVPIIVQPTQAEKNRAAASSANLQKGSSGPMRLYVGSLHFNITEDMLRGIFEPFGKVNSIDHIQLIMDPETGRSKGYGFITFHDSEDAKKALEQLNGFELAGRPMKVGHVTERTDSSQGPSFLDSDELDRTGIDLGATGRLQLMAKLAEGTGFEIPTAAANALNMNPLSGLPGQPSVTPPIATQCFMLSNMFDPTIVDSNPTWDVEIRDDVIEECNKHGGVMHIFVDKASPQGNVYVKCPSISAAVASVNALHGRWFAGKVITAAYVPLLNYHSLFPEAMTVASLLMPSTQRPG